MRTDTDHDQMERTRCITEWDKRSCGKTVSTVLHLVIERMDGWMCGWMNGQMA